MSNAEEVERLYGEEPSDGRPHFVTRAWPRSIPAELLALPGDTQISLEDSIGGQRGNGICSAGDYRKAIEYRIARQAEGYFTLNEAAQVLVDARPGLDPIATVKRFRLAHLKGELPIHEVGSRFRLEVGETIRDFLDLLDASELDTWLRKSAGYGFPAIESVNPSNITAPGANVVAPAAHDWQVLAREEARSIRKDRAERLGTAPSLAVLGDEVAKHFRTRGINGPNGHPLTGAYIKRHALQNQGITSPADKLRAMGKHRGK